MKKFLLYNSRSKNEPLLNEVIEALRQKNFFFTVFSNGNDARKNGSPWLPVNTVLILVFLPLWCLLYGIVFLVRTVFSTTRTLVCIHWPEKLIISPLAKFFKWRVIWLELPDAIQPQNFFIIKFLYQWAAKKSEIIIFSQQQEKFWEQAMSHPQSLTLLRPLTYPQSLHHQQDLFKALADRPRHRFVIGSIIDNLDKMLIERLLSALVVGLSVCSSLELIIIGDGENRKQLLWLIRKMGLGNHVWLVGNSKDFLRWLEHVDMYVLPHENPSLEEIAQTILVMNQGIPVLGHYQACLDQVITSRNGALIDMKDAETIARQMIHLEQAGSVRKEFGQAAKQTAKELTFEQFVLDFSLVLGAEGENRTINKVDK
jgi:glycosyltransferase involved in cell wall biosynthesis